VHMVGHYYILIHYDVFSSGLGFSDFVGTDLSEFGQLEGHIAICPNDSGQILAEVRLAMLGIEGHKISSRLRVVILPEPRRLTIQYPHPRHHTQKN